MSGCSNNQNQVPLCLNSEWSMEGLFSYADAEAPPGLCLDLWDRSSRHSKSGPQDGIGLIQELGVSE